MIRRLRTACAALVALMAASAVAQGSGAPTLVLPPRPADAPAGGALRAALLPLTRQQRETRILAEVASGNVPDFLRTLAPVTTGDGTTTVTLWVTPDYFSIGSDDDFIRVPLGGSAAQAIADATGTLLPTRQIVDAIHLAAPVKLEPAPFHPNDFQIESFEVMMLSNDRIQSQFAKAALPLGTIVSGIKKDVVISGELLRRPKPARVAIYGWHRLDGSPIQPLSLVHHQEYVDYSHGIRLVSRRVALPDGGTAELGTLISDPATTGIVNDEKAGAFESYRYPITAAWAIDSPLPTPPAAILPSAQSTSEEPNP